MMTFSELIKKSLFLLVLSYSLTSFSQSLNERLDSSNTNKNQLERLKSDSDPQKVREKDLETVKKQNEIKNSPDVKSYSWFEVNQKKIFLTIGFLIVCFFVYHNYFKKK
ncbi:hypothetical protein ICV32_02970 [Polynucleobacter sp. MWH-UH24A]|uniref:hypothetical protein n=1 Tax=Polynucleobacter sp. MWH-UH24A TaxID=2689110 RepID=UPI001BFE7FE2|nr:hypothetical protein [Polynucleobacter sp. MWH-UH24A]QWD76641.1 hypothetical protein ICV32_02970 [Polynucleobacter sp. MWH-UH24A]